MDFETLYGRARGLPIIDWHNHLDMRMLAEDKPLGSLYEVWVKADPYKHRAMRICGEPERLVTGDAPEAEKWAAWRRTLPKLVGNPLFAWAKMEMEFLGIDGVENVSLADWTPSRLLKAFNVEYCDPGYRMDAGAAADFSEMERVHARGGRVLDISADDVSRLESCFPAILPVASFAVAHGWTMLLHMGALRETSARMRAAAGPAGGFAGMRGPLDPAVVARFLDRLESAGALPRTILLTLNPEAHAQLAVLAGSFVEEGVPGKVQLGPAWWWCDHAEGHDHRLALAALLRAPRLLPAAFLPLACGQGRRRRHSRRFGVVAAARRERLLPQRPQHGNGDINFSHKEHKEHKVIRDFLGSL